MNTNINNVLDFSRKLEECAIELGLRGKLCGHNKKYQVAQAALLDSDGQEVMWGSANGNYADLKAQAEAIEHFAFMSQKNSTSSIPVDKILNQPGFNRAQKIIGQCGAAELTSVLFQSLQDSQKTAWVPVPMVCISPPSKTGFELSYYASSSGCAFHQDLNLARQHAVLEILERHLISRFMSGKACGSLVSENELDLASIQKVQKLQTDFKGSIEIYSLESEFQLPTVIAIFRGNQSQFPIPQTGSKSALEFSSALSGALNELAQVLCLFGQEEYQEDIQALVTFSKKTSDQNLFRDIVLLNNLKTTPNSTSCKFLPQTYEMLLERSKSAGFSIWCRTLINFKNKYCVVQVFIPGMDKVNLIRLGRMVESNES